MSGLIADSRTMVDKARVEAQVWKTKPVSFHNIIYMPDVHILALLVRVQ